MAARKGRPSRYTKALGDRLCAQIAEGKSLRTVCADPSMPATATFYRWMRLPSLAHFREQYARACEDRADAMHEDLLEIADEGTNDTYVDDHGNVRTDVDVIQRSKLRIETRKWLMGKMKPKVYGDKLDLTSGGDKIAQPVAVYSMKLSAEELKQAEARKKSATAERNKASEA